MEDAAAKLLELADAVGGCTRCAELARSRKRAVPGGGHPHAHVMLVAPHPSEQDEAGVDAAGRSLLAKLADLLPGLSDDARSTTYVTALMKCVPRTRGRLRHPLDAERDACFSYLSAEISTITPHLLLPVGRETSAFILERLIGRAVTSALPPGLRVLSSPSFRVVAIASPEELDDMTPRDRRRYVEQLRALAERLGL